MDVELDIEEFRKWFPGLTEEAISDAVLDVFGSRCRAPRKHGRDELRAVRPGRDAASARAQGLALLRALPPFATLATRGDQPGRVASASEGSVSTSFDLIKSDSQTAQWWTQTPSRCDLLMMTMKYRRGGRLYFSSHYHPWG